MRSKNGDAVMALAIIMAVFLEENLKEVLSITFTDPVSNAHTYMFIQ